MNRDEAKRILALYRPGSADGQEPEIQQALELTKQDPELRRWLDQHGAFQGAMREKFRQLEVPSGLKDAILEGNKIVAPLAWWRRPGWMAAAAAIIVLFGLSAFWSRWHHEDEFVDYRARIVRTALRQYRMDIVTNDLTQIRQFLATNGAPADYVLTKGLQPLSATGAGLMRWRDQRVSMVCFDRGDRQMLFLFVVNRSALQTAPPARPQLAKVYGLMTASWSQGNNAYVLAGPEDTPLLRYSQDGTP